MKSSKRITALIVALIFVLTSMMSFNVFADDDGFTDLDATNPYYQAITSLVADGVINGYAEADGTFTFKPDNTITRAEFSKLLATASAPIGYAFTATATQFPDVADANAEAGWAVPYIAYAVGTGAINGYEDGTFRPQNPVTYAEAVKMIVCTLGYGPVVNTALDPWYQGYIEVANQIGLTNRAVTVATNDAPRGLVAQLIYNMKNECKVYSAVIDNSGNEISIKGGNTTIDESEEGILYGVFEYCLTGNELTRQEVLIDDEIYQLGSKYTVEELKEYVGYSIKFSITGDRKKALTKVSKVSGENDTTTVEDWQIASVDADEIEYYANRDEYEADEPSTLKLANNLYVVYNGNVVNPDDIDDDFIEEYLDVTSGEIKFISNDGNAKTAEVAIVESYDLYHVKSFSTVNGVTTFYDTNASALGLTGGIAIDEDDAVDADGNANVTKITTKGGSATSSTLTAISKNSTVAVAVPFDSKEGTKVIISTVSFSGTVKELDSSYEYVKIGNEEYEFSPYFDAIMDAGVDVSLETGDTAKFYLDPMGRISYLEKSESSNPYGLIIAYASGSGVDSIPRLQILNTSSKILEYPLDNKVKINGKSYESEEAIDYLRKTRSEKKSTDERNILQLVKYVTSTRNGNTVFSEFETADEEGSANGNIVPFAIKNTVNTKAEPYANGGTLDLNKSSFVFKDGSANQFTMDGSTIVFNIPFNRNETTKFKKVTRTYFTDDGKYCVEPYDVADGGTTAKVVLNYITDSKISGKGEVQVITKVAFVEAVRKAKNDSDEDVRKLIYYYPESDVAKEVLSSSDSEVIDVLDTLKPGDLIKFHLDNNEIDDVEPVYTDGELLPLEEKENVKDNNPNWIIGEYNKQDDYYQLVKGYVYSIDSDAKSVNIIPADELIEPTGGESEGEELEGEESEGGDSEGTKGNIDLWETFVWTDSTSFFDFDEKNKEFIKISEGEIRPYLDVKLDASKVIIIVVDDKIVAFYDLADNTQK